MPTQTDSLGAFLRVAALRDQEQEAMTTIAELIDYEDGSRVEGAQVVALNAIAFSLNRIEVLLEHIARKM